MPEAIQAVYECTLRPLVGTPFAAAMLSGTGLLCNLQLWLYRQLRILLLLRIATSNASGMAAESGYVICITLLLLLRMRAGYWHVN